MIMLFIYGTLKHNGSAHHLLADQQFLGEAITEPRYRLIDLGPHPTLIEDSEHGLSVRGELWSVSPACLAKLDDYEGAPHYYARKIIHIANHDENAQAYFCVQPIPPGLPGGDRWPLQSPSTSDIV